MTGAWRAVASVAALAVVLFYLAAAGSPAWVYVVPAIAVGVSLLLAPWARRRSASQASAGSVRAGTAVPAARSAGDWLRRLDEGAFPLGRRSGVTNAEVALHVIAMVVLALTVFAVMVSETGRTSTEAVLWGGAIVLGCIGAALALRRRRRARGQ